MEKMAVKLEKECREGILQIGIDSFFEMKIVSIIYSSQKIQP